VRQFRYELSSIRYRESRRTCQAPSRRIVWSPIFWNLDGRPQLNWHRFTMSDGRWRTPSTSSRHICEDRAGCSGVRRQSWCFRRRGASSWHTLPFVLSCTKPHLVLRLVHFPGRAIRIRCHSRMPSASHAARYHTWRPFPPQDHARRARFHQAILRELLAERVSSSRGRVVPRGLKRKMSNYPLRPRRRRRTRHTNYRIRLLK